MSYRHANWENNIMALGQLFDAVVLTEGTRYIYSFNIICFQTFLFKIKEVSYFCKLTPFGFLTTENV